MCRLLERPGLVRRVVLLEEDGLANGNIDFHMLFLGGACLFKSAHPPVFRPAAGPGANELQRLVEQIGAQVGEVLERRGLIGHSTKYRIAVGPRAVQKLFTLQTVPPRLAARVPPPRNVAMSRAKRLKRVFGIEIATCQRCGGRLRIIASIEQPGLIARILAHLERTAPQQMTSPGVVYE